MKKLPKYWYVLYKNEDEFNEIGKWLKNTIYTFEKRINECGFSNLPDGEWFDSKYQNDIDEAKKHNAVQLTFEEWQILVCGKTLISSKTDLTKLLHILKFIKEYERRI